MFAGLVTLTPAAVATEGAVVNTTGSYCAYSAVTNRMACVNDEKDDPAPKSAALGTDSTSASPATQFLVGRFFDDDQFSTAHGYIDFFPGPACTASASNVDSGWIDTTTWRSRISSFRGYSNCRIKAWESTSYTGSSLPYLSSRSNDQSDGRPVGGPDDLGGAPLDPWYRKRYHGDMAMTLRLDDAETDALRRRASIEARSMQDVARAAVREYIERRSRADLLEQVLAEEIPPFAEALDRLGQ